jgi:hypothetical protein
MTYPLLAERIRATSSAPIFVAVFDALAPPLPAQADDKLVAETFQNEVCDVAAIFSRLSGTATRFCDLIDDELTLPLVQLGIAVAPRLRSSVGCGNHEGMTALDV